jgi:5-methylcytosine-specific restriction enzyme subunit McrC
MQIPLKNVWHMFLYAWDLLGDRPEFDSAAEDAPSLSLLTAALLVKSLEKRTMHGLPRGYMPVNHEIGAIRGRLDVLQSVRTQSFERGRAYCHFQDYSVDTARNRIIRGTLARLLSDRVLWAGEGGEQKTLLRRRVERCNAMMANVAVGPATHEAIRREAPGRNHSADKLVLALCELILDMRMPLDRNGDQRLKLSNNDERLLRIVYERFVARFLKQRLSTLGWKVRTQRRLKWPELAASSGMMAHMPGMQTDVQMLSPDNQRRIIVDTKFTNILATGMTGREVFKSGHLYQVYSYVQTQASEPFPPNESILLYPAINQSISEFLRMPAHVMRLETIDLSQAWLGIERCLLNIILEFPKQEIMEL